MIKRLLLFAILLFPLVSLALWLYYGLTIHTTLPRAAAGTNMIITNINSPTAK